jgi:CubicO group peptidase (beta-lactamase class C family)
LLVTTLLLDAAAVRAQATIGGAWREEVEAFARRLVVVEADLVPGMQVAAAAGDWVVYDGSFGSADLVTGRPVTGDTRFYIASSTKSLTALAAVLAARRGELDLDAPMVRYLPNAQLAEGVPREAITLHHLLSLTHGLDGGGPVVLRTAFTGDFTRDDLLALLRYHRPEGDFGRFRYNNLGYNLLGLVLEARYGTGWKEVVHREVLDPVGMGSTTAYPSRLPPDQLALPHDDGPEGFERIDLAKDDANAHAAGGHFTTARGLARYLAAHISGGLVEGQRVLPEEAVLATHRQQVAQDREFGPFHRYGWAYGWDLGTYEGDTLVHRFGGFSGFRSHMSFMPQHRVGAVVLVNGGGAASSAAHLMATYVYARLLGKPEVETRYATRLDSLVVSAAESRRAAARHLAERRARLAPLPHPLEAYAGVFESPVLGRMEWRVIAGGLEMRMGVVRSRAEVFDAGANRLRVEIGGRGTVATFSFPEGGGLAASVSAAGQEFVRVEG